MSGSGGDRGYDYQADAYAYLAAHAVCGHPLGWFDDIKDAPCAIKAETGLGGDDLSFVTLDQIDVEIQAKHALRADAKFHAAVLRLLSGLRSRPQSRAVLLVDGHASETIREDFKRDVIRFSQGRQDDLTEVFQQVLNSARPEGLDSSELFSRLRVVVVDLDEAGSGVSIARELLSRVVPAQRATDAFRLLGKQGHRLIKDRGQQGIHELANSLDTSIGLISVGVAPAILWHQYRQWTTMTNSSFFSTALDSDFPIHHVWNSLRVLQEDSSQPTSGEERLAKAIKSYHEWARLADTASVLPIEAEDLIASNKRIVVLGGPGSGKSTLAQRLAHAAAEAGRSVFRVRLPSVQSLMSMGSTFDEALAAAAAETSPLSAAQLRELGPPSWLLADGLDECDPDRAQLAECLRRWAVSHPDTSVCVFSRPVGHSPSLLPGFLHTEMLPLSDWAIQERSEWFFQKLQGDTEGLRGAVTFIQQLRRLDKTSSGSLASRNPLLLTFLVRLYADGEPINETRTRLFGRIIELAYRTSSTSRASTQIERPEAHKCIDAFGYSVLESATRPVEEVTRLTAQSMGGTLDAERLVERAIRFWKQRGLLETLSIGSLSAVAFVHPALGEYAAGRHLGNSPPDELRQLIQRHYRSARWREPLLHAAGNGAADCIVKTLLDLDDPADPASDAAMLAAYAAVESQKLNQTHLQQLIERLQARLQSPIPLVSVEAGVAMQSLSRVAPVLMAELVRPLLEHPQPWTRLAAFAVAVTSNCSVISPEQARSWLREYKQLRGFLFRHNRLDETDIPYEAAELQDSALPFAAKLALEGLGEAEGKELFGQLLPKLGARDHEAIRVLLDTNGHCEWARDADSQSAPQRDFARMVEESCAHEREAAVFFLECVCSCTDRAGLRSESRTSDRPLVMGMLLDALNVWESAARAWTLLCLRHDPEVVTEVIRGTMIAIDADPVRLAAEAQTLLAKLTAGQAPWYRLAPKVPATPVWSRAKEANLDASKLVQGLAHSSTLVVVAAAQLISETGIAPSLDTEMQRLLDNGRGFTLQAVGALATDVWGDKAFEVLRRRLSNELGVGSEYLYKWLLKVAIPEQNHEAAECILRGIVAGQSRVAAEAAKSLEQLPDECLRLFSAELRAALEKWDNRELFCEHCKKAFRGRSCPDCNVIPPDPRASILRVLCRLRLLRSEELLAFGDSDSSEVADEASKRLVEMASTSSTLIPELAGRISESSGRPRLLNALLDQPPETLDRYRGELLLLLNSDLDWIRARVIGSISSGWLDADAARKALAEALNDRSPSVRSAALHAIREFERLR